MNDLHNHVWFRQWCFRIFLLYLSALLPLTVPHFFSFFVTWDSNIFQLWAEVDVHGHTHIRVQFLLILELHSSVLGSLHHHMITVVLFLNKHFACNNFMWVCVYGFYGKFRKFPACPMKVKGNAKSCPEAVSILWKFTTYLYTFPNDQNL